jgi:hypothetical protein
MAKAGFKRVGEPPRQATDERFEQCVRDPTHCQTDEPEEAMIRNKLTAYRIAR